MKINIAIDGPSAAGKSTIAKKLAKKLGYIHLDTGAMYRCVALKAMRNQIDWNSETDLVNMIAQTEIILTPEGKVFMDQEEVTTTIRANEISMGASSVSVHELVRKEMVNRQQEMAREKGFIMDGRDIGTVVLKDAELKIFLTASALARAERRCLENKEKGIESDLLKITKEIEERDYQDTHRQHSPLTKAEDAIEIDSSNLTIDEVTEKIMSYIK